MTIDVVSALSRARLHPSPRPPSAFGADTREPSSPAATGSPATRKMPAGLNLPFHQRRTI